MTLATALIEPPDWLLWAYREGRCRGINELYDLRRLHGEHGDAVEAWAAQQPTITRDRLTELLRALLEGRMAAVPSPAASAAQTSIRDTATRKQTVGVAPVQASPGSQGQAGDPSGGNARPAAPEAPVRSDQRVHVEFEGHDYQLVVSVVPDHAGCMCVRPLTGGPRRLAPVAALKLLGFVGG